MYVDRCEVCLRGSPGVCVDRCEVCLGEFLQNIMRRPQKVDFPAMANLLVVHSQSSGNDCNLSAVGFILLTSL